MGDRDTKADESDRQGSKEAVRDQGRGERVLLGPKGRAQRARQSQHHRRGASRHCVGQRSAGRSEYPTDRYRPLASNRGGLNPIGAKDAAKAFLDAVKADYGNKRTWHDVKWRIESFGEMAGARASSLLAFLDPTNTQYGRVNLSAIARESGFTKGALSRALLDLRDQTGISLNNGKLQSSRATYAQAQRASYANGDHSGQHRKDRNPARRPSREGKAAETALSDWLGSLAKSEALY
jgi:hypothetical protein